MRASYTVTHQKPRSFYPLYERKADLKRQTHYCPGCGHGITHKLLARAIDELGVQDRLVLISPVGCSVFAYYYFDVGNIQVAHGRAPAVATAVKRSRPGSIVVAYQGDGDLAAIGTAEIIHAANRGEGMMVVFVNNGIYGMTGGQMAPTTPLGGKSTTSPFGRNPWTEGYPMRMCELLHSLEAPVFIERVGLGDNKQIMQAGRALKRALEVQVKDQGFSFVEVLSPCPTIWKLDPLDAQRYVREEMTKTFTVSNVRDRTKDAPIRPAPAPAPPLEEIARILGLVDASPASVSLASGADDRLSSSAGLAGPASGADDRLLSSAGFLSSAKPLDLRIRIAGFGGQGVLMLGEVLAEAGLDAGYEVSWLPSYGPEMRSGTSNCHVRVGSAPVDSPIVSRPNILLALNEPSLRKFLPSVEPGAIVLYNADTIPEDCARADLRMRAMHFTRLADALGSAKAANIVALGALLESSDFLDERHILSALRKKVKSRKWLDLDIAALALGRKEFAAPPPL
jgi:2-oxoisovalerate ferredoxin oxidoreductase beta subunit